MPQGVGLEGSGPGRRPVSTDRSRSTQAVDEAEADAAPVADPPRPDSPEVIAESTRVDPLELEVAYDLVDLVDTARGGDLPDRVKALRRNVALHTGLVVPLVRTKDNLDLPSGQYVIHLNGVPVAKGVAPAGTVLAIGDRLGTLPGTDTKEPVFECGQLIWPHFGRADRQMGPAGHATSG